MKRISSMILITECPYSGILKAILENANILKKLHFKIQFIVPKESRDRYGETLEENSKLLSNYGKVTRLPIKKSYSSLKINEQIISQYLKNLNKPIVIIYGSYAGKICRLLYRKKIIKNLYHTPQCIDILRMPFIYRITESIFEKILAPFTSHYIACSPSESLLLNKKYRIPADKIILCPNSIATIKSKYLIKNTRVHEFIFVGRLIKSKGIENILRVFKLLNLLHKITIIGDGPELQTLKTLYPETTFLGNIPNKIIYNHLSKARFFISNSAIEGLPFSVLEAMSVGTVPILSSIDGHKDLIIDSYNGFLFSNESDLINLIFKTRFIDPTKFNLLSRNASLTANRILKLSENNFIEHFKQYE